MSTATPGVSVLVPVHNAGKHLAGTLAALLDQQLGGVEILLLGDAPTDGSDLYCQEMALRYPDKISYSANSANMGTGATRNRGLELAQGEYIAFCDHDDLPEPGMLETLYAAANKQKADMVVGGYRVLRRDTVRVHTALPVESIRFGTQATVLFPVWNKLFRTAYLREHGIRFARARTFEDANFVGKVLAHGPRLATVDALVYTHILRESSASYSLRLRHETLTGLRDLADHLKAEGLYETHKKYFLRMALRHAVYYPACLFFLDTLVHRKNVRDNLRDAPAYAWELSKYLFSLMTKSQSI